MRIRRLEIRNFRKLIGPVVIDGLGDGLTVVAGDNEEGKSTVLKAIQAVLFDRHGLTGEAAAAMLPFQQKVRPEITIAFDLDGTSYTLRKAFCQRPEAELSSPGGQRWSGDEVEDHLRDLLSFEPPGRGAAKNEHRGIWGLFWVEQTTSFAPFKVDGSSREAIAGALESEVGHVLGGERGRALNASIERLHSKYYTDTGKAKGDLKEVATRVAALQVERDQLAKDLGRYEALVDQLGQRRARLVAYERDDALAAAERALADSEAEQKRIDSLETALNAATNVEKVAAIERNAAQLAWTAREGKLAQLVAARQAAGTGRQEAATVASARDAAAAEKATAESRATAAQAELKRAEGILDAAERTLARARLASELDSLQGRLEKARDAEAAAGDSEARARAIRVDPPRLDTLRQRESAAAAADMRLRAIATRIDITPDHGRRAYLDGALCAEDQPLMLTETARLTLDGFGALTVTPGGDDLAARRRDADKARQSLRELLAELGAADTATAERLAAERTTLLSAADKARALVEAHAPEGLAALARSVALKRDELAELSLGVPTTGVELDAAVRDQRELRRARDAAKETLARAEVERATAADRYAQAQEAWIKVNTERKGAESRVEQLRREIDQDRRTVDDDTLRNDRDRRAEALERAHAVTAERRLALEAADPEAARLRREQRRDALVHLRRDIEKLKSEVTEREGELRGLGQAGLGERLAEVDGALERETAAKERLERRAAAVRLLRETLIAAERDAKEAFLGPVRERLAPYLRLVFADAELALANDTLGIVGLRRGGFEEPFDDLSVGTREQLAVLTRLAFADFLRAKGRPAAIILDDALAYADDGRFERMQLVLRKAAERLQIIILTCRERDYRTFGAPIIRLSDCAAGAAAAVDGGAVRRQPEAGGRP